MGDFVYLIDLMPGASLLASPLLSIYAMLYSLNWANRNHLFRNSVFLWIGWAVSAILSVIFYSFLNLWGNSDYFLFLLLFLICLMNVFSNVYLLSSLQKENDYESFLTEKKECKVSEKVLWKTAITLAIITNTTALLVFILFVSIAQMFPRRALDFPQYSFNLL